MRIPDVRTAARNPLVQFFGLVFVLSAPFWLLGYVAERADIGLPYQLPISALQTVCPVLAASIAVAHRDGPGAAARLCKQILNRGRTGAGSWYLAAIFLMPLIMLLSYWVQVTAGSPIPPPHIALLTVPVLFLVYLITAACEELGWMGYAMPLMRRRGWGTTASSLTIGVIWAVWHYIPLLEAGRTPAWIAWWSLGTVAARVIIVWLYNNAGASVLVAAVFHAMVNLTYSLFPVNGSYYNPAVAGVIEAAIAMVIIFMQEMRRRYLVRSPSAGPIIPVPPRSPA